MVTIIKTSIVYQCECYMEKDQSGSSLMKMMEKNRTVLKEGFQTVFINYEHEGQRLLVRQDEIHWNGQSINHVRHPVRDAAVTYVGCFVIYRI